jgi:hypothetical protein
LARWGSTDPWALLPTLFGAKNLYLWVWLLRHFELSFLSTLSLGIWPKGRELGFLSLWMLCSWITYSRVNITFFYLFTVLLVFLKKWQVVRELSLVNRSVHLFYSI